MKRRVPADAAAALVISKAERENSEGRGAMKHMIWRAVITGCVLTLAGTALGQQAAPAPMRVRGQIEKVDGNTLTVKARDGAMIAVNVPDNVRVTGLVKASLADIKPNSYIGVTAMPQSDG